MIAEIAAVVALAAPAGFVENPTLDARAAWIAGKPVSVYCARTDADWQAYVASLPAPPPDGGANGYTPTIGGTVTYLSPAACAPLLARIRRHAVTLRKFGASLDILAHEATHLAGTSDEGQTECAAIRSIPSFVLRWGFRRGSPASLQVQYGAREFHDGLPAQYRAVC